MNLKEKVLSLISEIEELKLNPSPEKALPQNTFYLNERDIVCLERAVGENRYPLEYDGLVLWARSSGLLEAHESNFNIFKEINYCDDPSVAFFVGLPMEKGGFFPVSVLGSACQLIEPEDIKRYVVYSPRAAYYITDTSSLALAVRIHIDSEKHIHFAFTAINKTDKEQKFYMYSSIEAMLRFFEFERFWEKMTKYGLLTDNGSYMLRGGDNCLIINEAAFGGRIERDYHTVGKNAVMGGVGKQLTNAVALKTGEITHTVKAANTTDIPFAADLVHYTLSPGEDIRREYDLSYFTNNKAEAEAHLDEVPDIAKIDALLSADEDAEFKRYDKLTINFEDWKGSLNPKLFNKFLRNVQKQVSLCALGKNYAGNLIGVRDVMQQLETSLIYEPEKSREKLITALKFILEDGRPPRQFSLPTAEDIMPEMDLRKYIDQGVWIISTVYTYLSYTNDYSILDEKCSYYVPNEENTLITHKSEICDTVLDHLIKIMDFLSRNLDAECGSYCLRALFGDWNDAVDGLGRTNREGREFGSGVSVMASLQFWQNCREIGEILSKVGKYTEKIEEYNSLAEKLEQGFFKYGIDEDSDGSRRVIHGWGDLMAYKLGSLCDPDGVSRLSSTSHSFLVLSGMIEKDPTLKKAVTDCYTALISKHGLKTFDKPFPLSIEPTAGRISTITAGTYENSAAYVHASMFAIMALFSVGESKWAWEEMEKSVVISHSDCTMTAFAMPNSYCESEEYEMDGESVGDWYTGSGSVLIKSCVKFGFGVCPNLDGLWLQTPKNMPSNKASISITVKGHPITIRYENKNSRHRKFTANGKQLSGEYSELMQTERVFIPTSELFDNMEIIIID